MLFFFMICLGLSLVATLMLLILLLRRVKVNRKRKNKRPASYLLPIGLTLLLILVSSLHTLPRTLDAIVLISQSLPSEEVTLQDGQVNIMTIEHQKRRYLYNRWQIDWDLDETYRMTYTPYSRHIISAEKTGQSEAVLP